MGTSTTIRSSKLTAMKRSGFTLVELLVVIAIIALLISILAPSLKTAKDLTRQMLCMTNQRNLGMALVVYAEANRGHILPGYWIYDTDGTRTGKNPDGQCLAFGAPGLEADGYLSMSARHTPGWAYVLGVWRPESLMYCPSLAANNPDIGDDRKFPKPWGTAIPTDAYTAYVRITYWYYPNVKEFKFLYGTQLANFPGDRPLLCDMFVRESRWGHTMSGVQWFMVFPDGHVGFKTSQKAVDLIRGLDAYSLWPDYQKVYPEIFGTTPDY
jgi:prepilin-type N-terminal cleavage/methylation domain-containing protein